MKQARWIGAVLLSATVVSVACSSSKPGDTSGGGLGGTGDTDGQGAGGSGGSGAGRSGSSSGGAISKAGASNSGGASGKAGSHTGGNAAGGDAAGSGTSGTSGTSGAAGAGGEGGADPCQACPGSCSSGVCVACLPSNDHCPSGQYCTDTFTCVPGCKDASSCISGVCGAQHDCLNCIADAECSAGKVCGNNQCAAPCTVAQEGAAEGCGTGLTCCGLHCIDEHNENGDCGACATACQAASFCGSSSCRSVALTSLCTIGKVAVVLDGVDDDAPARTVGAALVSSCTPTPTEREIDQTAATADGVANATTGQPVAGADELLVVAGGNFFAHISNFTETSSLAPIYSQQAGATDEYLSRASGAVVATFSSTEDPSHYYFVVQFMRDPVSGSLILNLQGFFAKATAIAASYFASELLPQLSSLTKSWYVYEWTDANANQMVEPAEVTIVDSGT